MCRAQGAGGGRQVVAERAPHHRDVGRPAARREPRRQHLLSVVHHKRLGGPRTAESQHLFQHHGRITSVIDHIFSRRYRVEISGTCRRRLFGRRCDIVRSEVSPVDEVPRNDGVV